MDVKKVYIETYGCQMNVNDTEVALRILKNAGFLRTETLKEADVILVMTCAIREGAEKKIWNRLEILKAEKIKRQTKKNLPPLKIGILGCMAERLKHKLIEKEKMVDIVAGPDSYKDLPRLLSTVESGQTAINVLLSHDETYADVIPVRLNSKSPSAFVSIMRGCNNMCTYCIVPFTRGRERSRPIESILDEVKILSDQGVKEVTLLGQNVNSYQDTSESSFAFIEKSSQAQRLSEGFSTIYKRREGGLRFVDLLDKVSLVDPEMRIRFTSPHPKDFPDEVLQIIKERPNICNQLHMPAQSGNTEVLKSMRRGYSREAYLKLIDHVRSILPDVALSSDFISGFCGESDSAHQDTVSLLELVKYQFCYIFPYSMREKTTAHHRLKDDVPQDVKNKRSMELHEIFRANALKINQQKIGTKQVVLVEGKSRRSENELAGRNDSNTKVIFPAWNLPNSSDLSASSSVNVGDYVVVQIDECSSQVLKGKPLYKTTLKEAANLLC